MTLATIHHLTLGRNSKTVIKRIVLDSVQQKKISPTLTDHIIGITAIMRKMLKDITSPLVLIQKQRWRSCMLLGEMKSRNSQLNYINYTIKWLFWVFFNVVQLLSFLDFFLIFKNVQKEKKLA